MSFFFNFSISNVLKINGLKICQRKKNNHHQKYLLVLTFSYWLLISNYTTRQYETEIIDI